MTKIITAMNNSKVNEELTKEKNVEVIGKNIQYKEGILELLDINSNIDYIIFEENLFGEIQTEKLIKKIYEKNKKCCNETPYFYINKCNPYKFQKKGGRTCRIWTQSTVSIFAWCIST